ncbi:hypothetical protein [Limnoglobus roseus]|uniref:hypothetical protein n=1 Tax=Limnoglobus roseus TaxID=2598579 RepID=UPI0011EB2912|nr:hypothetical protein [Limnoglobus roseus]
MSVLLRGASLYGEALRRGITLRLDSTLWRDVLPRISAGTLSPRAAVAYAGQPGLLKRLASLPFDVQDHFAAGGRVSVIPAVGAAPTEMGLCELYDAGLAATVINGGRLVDLDAQRASLAAKAKYARGAASHATTAAPVAAGLPTDADIGSLAAFLGDAMRTGNIDRPTPLWIAERVVVWMRGRAGG